MRRDEIAAILVSVLLHAALVGGLYYEPDFLFSQPLPPPKTIAVEIVEVGVRTEVKQRVKAEPEEEAPEPEPEAEPEEETQLAASAPAQAQPETPPPSQETPPPLAKVKEEKLPDPPEPEKPKPADKPKRRSFAQALDKASKEREKIGKKVDLASRLREAATSRDDIDQQGTTEDVTETVSLEDSIKQWIESRGCWKIDAGIKGVHLMTVTLTVQLNTDGSIAGPVQSPGLGDLSLTGREAYRTFVEASKNAVIRCAPYRTLPIDRYSEWETIKLNFIGSELG